ncbi:PriA Primosomal protein N' (replication factor Y) - superfamily II helicase [Candidatus Nanopelagicaceae bacterium]
MVKAVAKLKLKREVIQLSPVEPSGPFTVAAVWVDASVYHLDTPFSYVIPGNLSAEIHIGSLVSLPFHGREITGVVIQMHSPDSYSGLKSISKVIGKIPLLTAPLIEIIKSAAERYAAHPFDLIRSAIPDRMATIEKDFLYTEPTVDSIQRQIQQQYLQLPPSESRAMLIAKKVLSLKGAGGVLVILPDTQEVKNLYAALRAQSINPAVLDSQLSKSEYFKNFLEVRLGQRTVVIGTRSAIFAPVANLRSIIIYNEGSENLYEKRSPGWNARDIALIRREQEVLDLYFVGYSPSSEVSRFIDEEWVEFRRSRAKMKVLTYQPTHGELLPSRALTVIKKALHSGPVLAIVPSKGYAQAIRCAKCRTISRCECGGAHIKSAHNAPITCNHCAKISPQWQCVWCNHLVPSLQSRGIERHSHELGLLLPGIAIHLSSADHRIDEIVSSGLIISTPGMAPASLDGYSAVVILEGNKFLDQPDMRAGERVREMYFAHAALASSGSPIILVQDEGHAIATALSTWNPVIAIHRDLEERKSLSLPPYVRIAHLTMESSDITRLKNALISSRDEGRLPESTKILGPIPSANKASLILSVDTSEGESLITTVHEFMRRRSASKKDLPSLRIDPYSLSR